MESGKQAKELILIDHTIVSVKTPVAFKRSLFLH